MANEPSITWKVVGASYDQQKTELSITEYPDNLSMPEGGPYGVAIDAPSAVSMIKALRDLVSKQPDSNELKGVMQSSFAITFDRNLLLKTISQPKCEGVRFYLCLKKTEKGEDLLSLVTVGVDAGGKDLLYEYSEGTQVQDIATRSLVAEYGFPPGVLQQSSPSIDPFVLFKFSE